MHRMIAWVALSACAHAPVCEVAAFEKLSPRADERARLYLERCGLDEVVAVTSDLVRFPTVRAEQGAGGPAFRAMAAYLETFAKTSGLELATFRSQDEATNGAAEVWEVSFGSGDPSVAFLMHADVVPADPSTWRTPPFEARVEGGALIGRGTEDDKGPIAVVLVLMRTLQKFGVDLGGRVTALMGTGEEHDWSGMIAYSKDRPHATHVISLDASYPVVVAESGFVAWQLAAPIGPPASGCAAPDPVKIGEFLTQVPAEAKLVVRGKPKAEIDAALAMADTGFEIRVEEIERAVSIRVKGESIHSSEADKGKNPLWGLARAAGAIGLCEGGVSTLLRVVATALAGDHHGERLGLAYEHPMMGKLLVAPTMLETKGDRAVLSINMRRPEGRSVEEFTSMLDAAFAKLRAEVSADLEQVADERYVGKPAVADTSGPLVTTLLQIYADARHEPMPTPIAIRGGTYARLFPGAVSFGPQLPGRPYRGHAPDESIDLDALELMIRTTFEAARRLLGANRS
jgi:predicted dipeptidase